MKAAVHTGPFTLEVRDVPVPEIAEPDDVLVRVAAVGICGSDKHDLETPPRREQIPGHEFTGVVAAVGKDSAGFRVGDRVLVNPVTRCGRCEACRRTPPAPCLRPVVYGCRGDQPPGAMAEYCKVRAEDLSRVPDDVSLEEMALTDPLAVAVHAVNSGPPVRGENCAVLGAGVIGLLLAQVLRLRGAARIALLDILPSHLEMGRRLGDFECFSGEDADRAAADLEAFDCGVWYELAGGEAPTLDIAIRASRRHGRIILISQRPKGVWINYQMVLFKQLVLQGVALTSKESWAEASALIASRRVKAAPLITHRFPLEEVNEAVRTAVRGDSLKVMIRPGGTTE